MQMIKPKFYVNPGVNFNPPFAKRRQTVSLQKVITINKRQIGTRQMKYKIKKAIEFQQPKKLQFWAWIHPTQLYVPKRETLKQLNKRKLSTTRSDFMMRNYLSRKEQKQQTMENIPSTITFYTARNIDLPSRLRSTTGLKKRKQHQRLNSTAISITEDEELNTFFNKQRDDKLKDVICRGKTPSRREISDFEVNNMEVVNKSNKQIKLKFRKYSHQQDPKNSIINF